MTQISVDCRTGSRGFSSAGFLSAMFPACSGEKNALTRIQACVRELKAWLNHNRLHLNDNKTEVLVITTPSCANKHCVTDMIVGDSIIQPTAVARNIGVMFDNELSLNSQVSKLCQVAFFLHSPYSINQGLLDATCD